MKENRIDIQNTKKIILPNEDDRDNRPSPSNLWKTSIRVPNEDRTTMLRIEMRMQELGFRETSNQDKWHISLNLLHKLLDYVDESDVNQDADVQSYLEMLIDEKMGD